MDACVFGFVPCTFHEDPGRFRAACAAAALVAEQVKRQLHPRLPICRPRGTSVSGGNDLECNARNQ